MVDHSDVASTLDTLSSISHQQSKFAEAEALAREALNINQKAFGREHGDVALSLNNLAFAVRDQGRVNEAASLFREALAINRKVYGNEHRLAMWPLHFRTLPRHSVSQER